MLRKLKLRQKKKKKKILIKQMCTLQFFESVKMQKK